MTRSTARNSPGARFNPPRRAVASSWLRRPPRMAFCTALWLLEDFLEHEVRELSAFDLFRGEFHLANLRADSRGFNGGDLKIIA